jgi:hypothetical protein
MGKKSKKAKHSVPVRTKKRMKGNAEKEIGTKDDARSDLSTGLGRLRWREEGTENRRQSPRPLWSLHQSGRASVARPRITKPGQRGEVA